MLLWSVTGSLRDREGRTHDTQPALPGDWRPRRARRATPTAHGLRSPQDEGNRQPKVLPTDACFRLAGGRMEGADDTRRRGPWESSGVAAESEVGLWEKSRSQDSLWFPGNSTTELGGGGGGGLVFPFGGAPPPRPPGAPLGGFFPP